VYHEPGLFFTAHSSGAGNARAAAYVSSSLANVQRLRAAREQATGRPEPAVTPLSGLAEVARGLHPDDPAEAARVRADAAGDVGYFNAGVGRADASAAVARLRTVCLELGEGRVSWVHGRADRLLFEERGEGWDAVGAQVGGEEVRAEVTVVAAGAWTPALLPRSVGARLRAHAQPLAYLPLSAAECAGLAGRPIALNISSGIFAIAPPAGAAGEGHELKLAQHCFGYFHDVEVEDTEPGGGGRMRVSVPAAEPAGIPASARRDLERYLTGTFPSLVGREGEWRTKVCWYADSPTGDYLVDFAPAYGRSVLVASGGSGHAFKMLPVIGRWVLRRLEGRMDGEEGEELARKWRWRTDDEIRQAWETPGDGSKGGEMGLTWTEEMGLAAR
jgi:sarcosine oxidase/L-pipecolate oxidase